MVSLICALLGLSLACRDVEIQQIAKSIEELSQIFKELAVLVIDQGTILDRIDFNMEQVVGRSPSTFRHSIFLIPSQSWLIDAKFVAPALLIRRAYKGRGSAAHSSRGGPALGKSYTLYHWADCGHLFLDSRYDNQAFLMRESSE